MLEIWLHVIWGEPKTLQEAISIAMEVDTVLEATAPKAPIWRAHVQQVEGDGPQDNFMSKCSKQTENMAATFNVLEERPHEFSQA